MSFLGAGIGAGIGFVIGGPIGAALGLWLGSTVSKNKATHATKSQKNQTLFFVSLFSMLGKMAKADGVVSQEEISAINGFIKQMRLDKQDREAAISIFNNAKNDQYSIFDYATQYKQYANSEMREMLYQMLWQVAYSDGYIHQNEDAILKEIPDFLGIPSDYYERLKAELVGNKKDLQSYYEILGCQATDSDAQIKKSYKLAITQYHPDKIQSQGLPKEFIKFANEQSKKINEAYTMIKKSRKLSG